VCAVGGEYIGSVPKRIVLCGLRVVSGTAATRVAECNIYGPPFCSRQLYCGALLFERTAVASSRVLCLHLNGVLSCLL
jgi:hypothetical protein